LNGGARGICNLGGGQAAKADDPAFERFQQIDVEWPDIEPTEGKYDWSKVKTIANFIHHGSNRMALLKINSNTKPFWLYDQVPWVNITWTSEQADGKTAMYWHPAYTAALKRRIATTATFFATDPVGKQIAYFRQSWAAIGEEAIGIPTNKGAAIAALRLAKNWHTPAGCAAPSDYDADSTDEAYKEEVAAQWIGSFSKSVPTLLLLRANEYDGVFAKYHSRIASGEYGWFHTGAGMEETQCFNQTFRYAPFRADCRTGKTVGFAEACGLPDFAGPTKHKTPALDAANFTRLQGTYWVSEICPLEEYVMYIHYSLTLFLFFLTSNMGWQDDTVQHAQRCSRYGIPCEYNARRIHATAAVPKSICVGR
jgi:hypothetical protein